MATDKKGFMLYADQQSVFNKLTDEQAGQLIKHIYSYVNDEDPVTDNQLIDLVFEPIRLQLKRDLKKWEERQEQRIAAGRRSAEVRKQNATTVNDRSISSTVKGNVNVTVKGNVTDKVIKKEKEKSLSISNQNLSLILEDEKQVDEPEIKEKPQTPAQRAVEFKKSLLENNVSEDLADEFMAIRKEKKARNSDIAFDGFMREVKKSGFTTNEVVKRCCENGWKGFTAEWMKKENKSSTKYGNKIPEPHKDWRKHLNRD